MKPIRPLVAGSLYLFIKGAAAATACFIMQALSGWANHSINDVPFVTSIALITLLPDNASAKPTSIVGGHVLSALAGFTSVAVLGQGTAAPPLGLALAVVAMCATGLVHPPAALSGYIVPAHSLELPWLLEPVIVGSLLLGSYARLWRGLDAWLRKSIIQST
jgi:CBS-domain-containing membrane protein